MQPDPLSLGASDLSNPQSLNLYSYVGNDPINFSDPSGMNRRICYGYNILASDDGGRTWTLLGFISVICVDEGGDGSGGGGSGSGSADEKLRDASISDPCATMAKVAGMFAKHALSRFTTGKFTNYFQAVKEFDRLFGTYYAGGTMQSYGEALRLSNRGGIESTVPNQLTGDADFNPLYKNSIRDDRGNNDQTHHFAAHFSSGLNGLPQFGLPKLPATILQMIEDNDWGDRRLSAGAWSLGNVISGTPQLLSIVEDLIKLAICK